MRVATRQDTEASEAVTSNGSTKRLVFVDGLRGLAVSAVLLFHFAGHPMFDPPPDGVLGFLHALAQYGYLGVPVFFVISGFVIALSAGSNRTSPRYCTIFIIRRLTRLSPPYWFAIALAVLLKYAGSMLAVYPGELPGLGSVLSHAVYIYPCFGYEPIIEIFWTMGYIVQFYIFFILLLAVIRKIQGPRPRPPVFALLVIALPAVVSAFGLPRVPGLCLNYWYMFCLGVFSYWTYRGWVSWWSCGLLLACIASSLFTGYSNSTVVSLLATVLILLACRLGTLESWLGGRVFQFLGRISYSLYLIHGATGAAVLFIGERLTGRQLPVSLFWLCLAIAVSVLAAHLMHLYIELPSARWSKQLTRDSSSGTLAAEASSHAQ